jgi:carboxypeptidase Taq
MLRCKKQYKDAYMDQAKSLFSKLQSLSHKAAMLGSMHMLLEWDLETYMPKEGIESRSSQLELLAELIHKQKTAPIFKKTLSKFIDLASGKILQENTSLVMQASAREWRREFLQEAKLPASFVKKFAKTTSQALHVWSSAKKNSDFASFAPHLTEIVSLCRKKAEFLGYKEHPYDALLDLYEPNMSVKILTPLLEKLKVFLIKLLSDIQKTRRPCPVIAGTFSQEKQMQAGQFLLNAMGLTQEKSRLDLSSHPFCIGLHPKDTRMTTRIDLENPLSSLFSVMHEGGHGLYNKNLPQEYYGTPLCQSASLGIDESQSRFWETMIGRSYPFCAFFYPKLQELFPESLSSFSLEEFYQAINHVHPQEIRVEADEVTYSLHIILRFEIEKGLMDGSIEVQDIPSIWNQKMQESLFITPSSDKMGCLQDIHWAMGGIGYFPSYTIGNLFAAQLFSTIQKEHPEWEQKVYAGDLLFLEEILKDKIHRQGRIYEAKELMIKATGSSLQMEPYMDYLQTKYQKLYSLH